MFSGHCSIDDNRKMAV